MCIKSELKEIGLKLATNGRSDKGFLLTSKVCPQGVFCPCPGAIYMYKIIKNVYKIRFQRDHFETYNIQGSPFITLCLGSIELDPVISEPCYKGIVL